MSDAELKQHWRDMVAREDVRDALEHVYAAAMRAIAERQPKCEASGRCCRFEQYGHRLYVTGLEAAYTMMKLDAARPVNGLATLQSDTQAQRFVARVSLPVLSSSALQRARSEGGCPFQVDGLCSIHTIKPLACRTYFCDPTATEWQQDLTERLHAQITRIHTEYGVVYRYAEWRAMLEVLVSNM